MTADAPPSRVCEEVRRYCAAVAGSARWMRIDTAAATEPDGVSGLDPDLHLLEAPAEDIARYVLVLDAINSDRAGSRPSARLRASRPPPRSRAD